MRQPERERERERERGSPGSSRDGHKKEACLLNYQRFAHPEMFIRMLNI